MEWLIILPGPSISYNKDKIDLFIEKKKPVTIAVNNINKLFIPKYHLFVNRRRYKDHYKVISPDSKLIVGYKFEEKILKHKPYDMIEFENDYLNCEGDIEIKDDKVCGKGLTGSMIAAGYAILHGCTKLYFVGLDGFEKGKPHHVYKEGRFASYDKLMILQYATELILGRLTKYNPIVLTPTIYQRYYESIDNFI